MKQVLFIGLGGCGLQTVSQLSKKLSAKEDPDVRYHYLYIDTDEDTRAAINQYETVIPLTNFINVGDTNPYKVYLQATKGSTEQDVRTLEWAISQGPGHLAFPNQQLSDGAQADRMVGRTSLVQHFKDFKDAVEKYMNAFAEFKSNDGEVVEPDIWVVTSCCGGTGSSISIDTLYLIDRIANEKGMHASVKLVLYMPKPFIDLNEGLHNYPLNAFAYMWELNALEQGILDGGNDIFTHFSAYPWGFKDDVKYNLFKMVIPVDVETDRNTKIPVEDLYPTTAEMMYYLVVGKGAERVDGMLSNSLRESRKDSSKLKKYNDTDFLWGTWMVPYGYRVIRKANKELRDYMKTRATLEILRYGLLGEKIENDDDVREAAKKGFSAEYILPYLCEIDGVAVGEESLQGDLDEAFKSLSRLPVDGLDAQRINGFINNISKNIEDLRPLRKKYFGIVCESINKGISKEIANHGIQYTMDLLQLVDDYYLESLSSGALKNMQAEAESDAESLLGKLRSFAAQGINKKNASAAADTGRKYAEACKLSIVYKVTREIIKALTEQRDGYLEILRNGDSEHIGLYQLMNIVNAKVLSAQKDWNLLCKTFLDTKNDALTIYFPSLSQIAGGDNGNGWAEGSLFEELYYESVLPYDKKIASDSGRKVPARQVEGSTMGINTYLGQMIAHSGQDIFVKLAMSTPSIARTRFDTLISKDLSEILDAAVNAPGTVASNWLAQTLEEYVALNRASLNLEMLTNPTLIPILYPTKVVHTNPVSTSLLYVGANKPLAEAFGYRDNVNNTQFVKDEGMTDRFQILKMPVGLDFYSYKYFDMLQEKYYSSRESILAQKEGCHLHKAFRFLDLNKAMESIKTPGTLDAMKLFLRGLFLQKVVDTLKDKEPAAYQELMGVYDAISGFGEPAEDNAGEIDLLDSVGLGGPSGRALNLGTATVHDSFFRESIIKGNRTLSLKVTTSPCVLDTSNHLVVENAPIEFLLPDVATPQALADALNSATNAGQTLIKQLEKISAVQEALNTSAVRDAFGRVKADALSRVLTPGPDSEPTFIHLLRSWLKRNLPEYELFLNEIRQFFNSAIQ